MVYNLLYKDVMKCLKCKWKNQISILSVQYETPGFLYAVLNKISYTYLVQIQKSWIEYWMRWLILFFMLITFADINYSFFYSDNYSLFLCIIPVRYKWNEISTFVFRILILRVVGVIYLYTRSFLLYGCSLYKQEIR